MGVILDYRNKINFILLNYLIKIKDNKLRSIIDYTLEGGKRVRPSILYELCNINNVNKNYRDNIIVAIELLHNASLILDDMPNMDNDRYRRNKLCVHIKYGNRTAMIIANYLFFEALKMFALIGINNSINNSKLIRVMNYVNLQNKDISLGQYYDLFPLLRNNIEHSNDSESDLYRLNLKTIPLFVIPFVIPVIVRDNDRTDDIRDYENMAIYFSYMFQICDDFEDIHSDLDDSNHIKIFGENETLNLFNSSRSIFIKLLKKHRLFNNFFKGLINLIDNKLGSNKLSNKLINKI